MRKNIGARWSVARGQRSCCGVRMPYRFPYLVVALCERVAGRAILKGVLGVGRLRRCRMMRAGSVICGGRSWAQGAEGRVAWRVRVVARRAGHCPPQPPYWSVRAQAAALVHEWSPERLTCFSLADVAPARLDDLNPSSPCLNAHLSFVNPIRWPDYIRCITITMSTRYISFYN